MSDLYERPMASPQIMEANQEIGRAVLNPIAWQETSCKMLPNAQLS